MPEDTPRIAFYLRLLYGGGAERVMVNLMHGFVQRGLKVDLVLNTVDGPYLAQLPSEVTIVDLEAPRLPAGLFKLARYLRQEQPTALLSGLHYMNEIALWAKRISGVSTRLVVSEHSILSINSRHRSHERWSPVFARLFYPWADEIVAVSQGAAKDVAQVTGLPLTRIRVIYNPLVTPDLWEKSKAPLDHPWFASGEPPVVLGVGRLEEEKDFPTLIRAFAQVRQVRPARLVILGTGREQQALKALVKELGLENEVAWIGFVSNPYPYLARAAVFVSSSIWEGLGNVIVEAIATQTPVVSTDCPCGPAEILDNGKYGSLVPVGDSQAMAEAILSVLSGNSKPVDPTWLKQFTLETVIQQYLDVLGLPDGRLN